MIKRPREISYDPDDGAKFSHIKYMLIIIISLVVISVSIVGVPPPQTNQVSVTTSVLRSFSGSIRTKAPSHLGIDN
jgi:hypothetical protein